MDKFPLLWEGKAIGELSAEQETLYTWFTVRCRLPGEDIWCAWAVGDRGELRLVLPETGRKRTGRPHLSRIGCSVRPGCGGSSGTFGER